MRKKLGKEDVPSASSLALPARNDKDSVVFYETADSEVGGSQVGQLSDDLSMLLSPAAGCPRGMSTAASGGGISK